MHRSFPKLKVVRSVLYRWYVAQLPCWLCGVSGHSQAAHADQGKGGMFKTCDTTCFPACATHDGLPGCHFTIGTSGTYSREERRALELRAGSDTRLTLIGQSANDERLHRLLHKIEILPAL